MGIQNDLNLNPVLSDELGVELTFTNQIVKYLYLRAYEIKKQRMEV